MALVILLESMTNAQFEELCRIYGFAPSKPLRELIEAVIKLMRLNKEAKCE